MTPSQKCVDLIQGFERCYQPIAGRPGWFKAYMPTAHDRWTCGWGNTEGVTQGTEWSQAECDINFQHALTVFAVGVSHELGAAPTTQNQFDALVSFAYNVGLDNDHDGIAEGLGDSTLMKLHLAGKFALAALEFAKWDKQKGVVLGGLTRRRAAEAALYLEPQAMGPKWLNDILTDDTGVNYAPDKVCLVATIGVSLWAIVMLVMIQILAVFTKGQEFHPNDFGLGLAAAIGATGALITAGGGAMWLASRQKPTPPQPAPPEEPKG